MQEDCCSEIVREDTGQDKTCEGREKRDLEQEAEREDMGLRESGQNIVSPLEYGYLQVVMCADPDKASSPRYPHGRVSNSQSTVHGTVTGDSHDGGGALSSRGGAPLRWQSSDLMQARGRWTCAKGSFRLIRSSHCERTHLCWLV